MTRQRVLTWRLAALVAVMVLMALSPVVPEVRVGLLVGSRLFLGWLLFSLRVLPATPVNGTTVAAFAVGAAVLVAGLHGAGRWLVAGWPVRWTAAVAGTLAVGAVAGIAIIGAAHEAAWLATAKRPLTFRPLGTSTSRGFRALLRAEPDEEGNAPSLPSDGVRARVRGRLAESDPADPYSPEAFHLPVFGEPGRPGRLVVFRRDPAEVGRSPVWFFSGKVRKSYESDELAEALADAAKEPPEKPKGEPTP
jgi:hypothetical protein